MVYSFKSLIAKRPMPQALFRNRTERERGIRKAHHFVIFKKSETIQLFFEIKKY